MSIPPVLLRSEFIEQEMRNLPPRAVSALLAILSHIDQDRQAYPGLTRIGELMGTGWRTAKRAVKELEKAKLVTRTTRAGTSDFYTVDKRVTPRGDSSATPSTSGYVNSDRGEVETSANSDRGTPAKSVHLPLPNLTQEPRTKNQEPINQDSSSKKLRFSDQDMATAKWIFSLILAMNPGNKQPNLADWSNTIRLIRERDGRTDDEIRSLFAWANQDDFWRINILCPATLRKQWDKLTIKRKAESNGNGKQQQSSPARPRQRRYDANGREVVEGTIG